MIDHPHGNDSAVRTHLHEMATKALSHSCFDAGECFWRGVPLADFSHPELLRLARHMVAEIRRLEGARKVEVL